MIAGLSKAVVLYLTPLLALTSLILSYLAFLAPSLLLEDRVALFTITPSSNSSDGTDGASLFLGLLGSCSRPTNDAAINCTVAALRPTYDFSDLPADVPQILISSPPSAGAFVAVSLGFSSVFFLVYTVASFRHKMGEKMAATMDKPLIQRLTAWMGFIGFFIGFTTHMVVRMWFDKTVSDFNGSVAAGVNAVASIGNAFTMVWVANAFLAVPVTVSLSKLHVKASK
ncbi:uncharacterized protein EV420DRAFT_941197 [Desarmillaria tabescens]|uniref:Uncharacterized protein n=1 Tax=Armillaria tabescens TaxID=1929756 RepID=A0AA39NGD6_ARMTA|nr:uncharacterized protein EV420DRAFT_941197 [Desarmillaria tabescens]KAK0465144.1 hypothetical protein EV420DRAFT_941197 [Desarmillaria tabescens]